MKIYDYIKTTLDVFIAFMTKDVLLSIALVFLSVLIVWCAFSIFFCYEMDFKLDCERVTRFVKYNKITRENYVDFTSLFLTMSGSVRRAWKSYELCVTGMPSDYLKQFDCLDMPISGGSKGQVKKIMNGVINVIFVFLTLCGLAIHSGFSAPLTAQILLESVTLPLLALFVYKIVYYVYVAIRYFIYKAAVESFNDMLDILDERVSLAEIFDGYEDAVAMCSNVYSNETLNKIKIEENRKILKKLKREEKARRLEEQEKEREERMLKLIQERERAEIERKMQMIEKIKSTLPQEILNQEEIDKKINEENEAIAQKVELREAISENNTTILDSIHEEKRGRGRPRKVSVTNSQTEKRGRGRPRKEKVEVLQTEKRGRGRPRKVDNEKVAALADRTTILSEKAQEGKIVSQRDFVNAMNEVEKLLDANSITTATSEEIEKNNIKIDELVAKMMEYKKMNEEE